MARTVAISRSRVTSLSVRLGSGAKLIVPAGNTCKRRVGSWTDWLGANSLYLRQTELILEFYDQLRCSNAACQYEIADKEGSRQ
jgi:hypothetical protein